MRLKLLRRRLSISAPRMIVRSHLPWPLRWAVVALTLGFSAALAAWAFEVGKGLAGLDRDAKRELVQLRDEVLQLRRERDQAVTVANAADSLLKAERAAQDKLAQQVRQIEGENLALKADLGFFERLLPTQAAEGISIRALQAQVQENGQIRYQLLVMQSGTKAQAEFTGRYALTLIGTQEGRPWVYPVPPGPQGAQTLQLRQYVRLEGVLDVPPQAVVKSVQVSVSDASGAVRATQTVPL
ncbi:DUF6776 family protein [Piscinibacter sakaiensis]|uniref:Putative integral membrane protein n=1 Tax=Piscinibacter sakaiensis TaxID=1547922 RepID=A0A0K8NVV9_PISS1|nr:DUF6776 family protein [Piscinibacter sakaiensis]GAP34521.1 putative integral membrane protein [Piscinibacter sakaiensis]